MRCASATAQLFEQHAELVAAEARQRVARAELGLEQRSDLPQQLVAAAWPHVSFTTLNWSTSRWRGAYGTSPAPVLLSERSSRDSNSLRFTSPVSVSWLASMESCAVQLPALAHVAKHEHRPRRRPAVEDRRPVLSMLISRRRG